MKFYTIILSLILVLVSCKDDDKNQETSNDFQTEQDKNYEHSQASGQESGSKGTSVPEKEKTWNAPDKNQGSNTQSAEGIDMGTIYVKTDQNDANCSCYCIALAKGTNTELCLSENEMYINARYSKSGNLVNFYYINPSNKNTNEELPWKDFDTNIPIAVLTPDENGVMNLDWKGFSINGELAVDYALYGKKTLEGTYKKQ
ncbi:hypothetical protein DET49_11326 [Salegentibacter sp. 24]|uniref:hypothetical protein n=1 Tax=Salegentibacter sp. 24 TaxID=2183986 RepID=UPI00106030B5|nr:hypothetical protein [Salegentibacter sp. 24]TDN87167.1 hypothetical protein DET49_11326 [Salegentibacter sp. 24]